MEEQQIVWPVSINYAANNAENLWSTGENI